MVLLFPSFVRVPMGAPSGERGRFLFRFHFVAGFIGAWMGSYVLPWVSFRDQEGEKELFGIELSESHKADAALSVFLSVRGFLSCYRRRFTVSRSAIGRSLSLIRC